MKKIIYILCTVLLFMYLYYKGDANSFKSARLQIEMHNIEDSLLIEDTEQIQTELQSRYESILHRLYADSPPELAEKLANLSIHNYKIGNYFKAIKLWEEALDIYKNIFGEKHQSYAKSLDILATLYSETKNYSEAIKLSSEALIIFEKIYGKEHQEYATCLNQLSLYYSEVGDYMEALRLATEALKIREKVLGKEHLDYATSLINLAVFNAEIGDYSEAIKLEATALNIYEKVFGKEHHEYAICLRNLALYHFNSGDYSEAIRLSNEVLIVFEKLYGKEHQEYATCLNQHSIYYSEIGDYLKAIELATEALKIRERILGKEHIDYGTSLHNLALYCHYIGLNTESIRLNTEALNLTENLVGREHRNYAKTLLNLSSSYEAIGDYSEAIKLSSEALIIFEKIYGKEHQEYANCLHILALHYSGIGNDSMAIRLDTEALNINKRVLGKEHPSYAINLESLYTLNISRNTESAIKYLKECFEVKLLNIQNHFSGLTANERNSLWEQEGYFFTDIIPSWSYLLKDYNLTEYAYNGSLISKNILLNTEIGFATLLKESDDIEVKELYSQLQTKKQFINELYKIPIAERWVNMDSLEKEAQDIERKLIRNSKIYGNFIHNFSINWKKVQESLRKDDIAIEFLSIPILKGSIFYFALTLKKDYESPKMTMLFDAEELSEIINEDYLRRTAIYDLLWKPLQDELVGVKNIYFAPAGELYNIAIESVKESSGEGFIFDKWNMYRLSSTRELALRRNEGSKFHIALYGGIIYDSKGMVYDKIDTADNNLFEMTRCSPDSIGLRAGYDYLNGTLKEVIYIDSLCSNLGISTQLYTGITGSETSLKRLSGKRISNLHISTHGFYWSENEIKTNTNLRKLRFIQNDEKPTRNEEKTMTRSGLLLAGANALLNGDTLPDGCDDGILTALEVASLDLRDMDLLVLSACQTGLGDIKGDGIFGLQRGFKKAGVQTIMMSLWDVDDDATQLLMSHFYRNYLTGMPKHEAFLKAQKSVRETQGFEDPEYWAGFILLDGLN